MKKTHWAVIWGAAFLLAAFITYMANYWYGVQNHARVFMISFLVAAIVILLGQMIGRRRKRDKPI